ncbi:LysR family transcriptional regulator [Aeromicrobium sp. CTD01-1L150]|uniref:LysR family transcriptional regulator n=1 Tax=Aeromicrobium sp. CTD01-1L150 TaxID=3341830 RepID=UPI0035C257E4
MGIESIETMDLEVFLAVARNESISGAAQELRLSSPSVSTRIAALERKVGTRLFQRTARGSFTTPAGSRLREYAKSCLDLLHEAHRTLHVETKETVTVAIPASLGNTLMGPALGVLSTAGISANGRIEDTSDVIDYVVDRTIDIGFVVNGIVPSSLVSHRLTRSSVFPVVRPGHELLTADRSLAMDDLDDHPVAIYRWHADAEALGHMLGHSRSGVSSPTVFIGLPPAIVHLVLNADYVGLVAEFSVADQIRRGELVRLPLDLPSWTVDVDLVHRPHSSRGRAAATLLESFEDLLPHVSLNVQRRDE